MVSGLLLSKQKLSFGEYFEKLGLNEWLWIQCYNMGFCQFIFI